MQGRRFNLQNYPRTYQPPRAAPNLHLRRAAGGVSFLPGHLPSGFPDTDGRHDQGDVGREAASRQA